MAGLVVTPTLNTINIVNGTASLDIAAGVEVNIDAELHVTAAAHLDEAVAMSSKLTIPGAWTTPAFAAGDFTASGSMTWTVEAGDVLTYAYNIIGKIMHVMFLINTSTVAGTPSSDLRIKIPEAKTATKSITVPCYVSDNGTISIGFCTILATGTVMTVNKIDLGNFAAATNTTSVRGQITFEIN